jgi:hypothetical protein
MSRPLEAGRTANLVIRPRLARMSGTSPFHMTRCLEAGIEAAEAALPAIRALLAGEAPAEVAEEFGAQPRLVMDPGSAL